MLLSGCLNRLKLVRLLRDVLSAFEALQDAFPEQEVVPEARKRIKKALDQGEFGLLSEETKASFLEQYEILLQRALDGDDVEEAQRLEAKLLRLKDVSTE